MMNQAMDYLEEVDPDVEQAGLSRRKVMADLAQFEELLYEKRGEATQATLNAFFSRVSLPEAFASDTPHTSEEPHTSKEPHTSEELPASDEPQPSTSTSGFTCTNVPLPPDVEDV